MTAEKKHFFLAECQKFLELMSTELCELMLIRDEREKKSEITRHSCLTVLYPEVHHGLYEADCNGFQYSGTLKDNHGI